ncbi:hypothetical protein [Nonlabens sp.]|uniref:hypothetical protein n=1 Tax=Nonlabens sp. TaxID=1888209 RepID=UPI003267F1C1
MNRNQRNLIVLFNYAGLAFAKADSTITLLTYKSNNYKPTTPLHHKSDILTSMIISWKKAIK